MGKKWNFLSDKLDAAKVNEMAKLYKISPVMAALLLNRGIDENKIENFFAPHISDLYDPFLLKDMDKATERINKAVEKGEKITVYGDYDVDGITSVAIVLKYLKSKGAVCTYFIPERESDGYGLNKDAIDKIKCGGTSLIITVDNGISAVEEAEYVKKCGIDLVITDHHACGDVIPSARAVVNPKQPGCGYPFKELAGAGVCFKLICALEGNSEKIIEDFGEYVAIATIADVVSLTDENRTIVKFGMKKLSGCNIPWFDALCEVSGIEKENLNSYHIGFIIAPRLNAAGRMGSAYSALKLILSEDYESAVEYATLLDEENKRRKELGNGIFEEATEMIEKNNYADNKVIVLAKEGWHGGIIGITASKIAGLYEKNVFLLSLSGNEAKGSGRGVEGLNLYDALANCADCLSKYGGHAMAAGLSLPAENIDIFRKKINEYADSVIDGEIILSLDIDCRLSCGGSLLKLIDEIQKMEPFGAGNEKPLFAVSGAKISFVKKTKDGKHMMLRFIKGGSEFSAIAFGMGDMADTVKRDCVYTIAATLEKNEYLGNVSPQFHITDIVKEGR